MIVSLNFFVVYGDKGVLWHGFRCCTEHAVAASEMVHRRAHVATSVLGPLSPVHPERMRLSN